MRYSACGACEICRHRAAETDADCDDRFSLRFPFAGNRRTVSESVSSAFELGRPTLGR
jgi:hypothetical protein